jgi:hypothetical protein
MWSRDGIGCGLLLASALLLTACGPGTGIYDKPGVTYAEWKRDDAECRRGAGEDERGAIDRDAYVRCLRARGYKIRVE